MLQPLQQHYKKIPVVVETQHREYQIEVPARTPQGAIDFIQNIGVRESGYYDWMKISCENLSVVRG
ncbi:MAG TPA: hypothetical protein DCS91_02450 [Microcoleaceae bacterium UBA11344]|jgi:hypothetical protein|nr:hypothetical protein [Microcoleaceae cyanobacterium UBA11344]